MPRLKRGGIRPFSKKEITRRKPLMSPESPVGKITLPLRTPTGAILTPVVAVGDVVKQGELLAFPEKDNAVPLYSGIPGKIVEISHQPHPYFEVAPSLVIENDHSEEIEEHEAFLHPDKLSQEQILNLLKERGIRNTDPWETPVHLKIMENRGKVDTLIIDATEAEPYLTADHRLLLERQDMVVTGAKLLADTLGASDIVVALQGDKLDAIEELEENLSWDSSFMRVRTLPTRYPMGHEKILVASVTGKELTPQEKPYDAHCAVFPVSTAHAVGEAILRGVVQTHRAVTVSGSAVQRPRNFWLPLGTSLENTLLQAEGMRNDLALLLLGGPMTGISQRDLRCPVLLSNSAVLAFGSRDLPKHLEQETPATMPCIRCGHCLKVCPMGLMPLEIYKAMTKGNPSPNKVSSLGAEGCIGCGACNYRCPSRLPLVQEISKAQQLLETQPTPESDVKIYDPPEKTTTNQDKGGIQS